MWYAGTHNNHKDVHLDPKSFCHYTEADQRFTPAVMNLALSQRSCGSTNFSISSCTLVRPLRRPSRMNGDWLTSLPCPPSDTQQGQWCQCQRRHLVSGLSGRVLAVTSGNAETVWARQWQPPFEDVNAAASKVPTGQQNRLQFTHPACALKSATWHIKGRCHVASGHFHRYIR